MHPGAGLLLVCFLISGYIQLSRSSSMPRSRNIASYEYARGLDKAYQECSFKPHIQPFVVVDNSFSAKLRDNEVNDASRASYRGRRDQRFSAGRVLVLLPGQRGSLLRLGNADDKDEDGWLPDAEWTVDTWLRADGGQENPAVILAAEDSCSPFQGEGWELGIKAISDNGERDPRFYFRILTASSHAETVLTSPLPLLSNRWVHLAVTYDGEVTQLYVNGARVARSSVQRGKLFQSLHVLDSAVACRKLLIGGGFRGQVALSRLWKSALTHKDVMVALKFDSTRSDISKIPEKSNLSLWEDFEGVDRWDWSVGNVTPKTVSSVFGYQSFDILPSIPYCGFTLCDSPEIIRSYEANWELRNPKTLRYKIINVKNDDGTNETVSASQIEKQHRALNQAFNRYNISWEHDEVKIRNTSLRGKKVLIGCDVKLIGDGICHPKCAQIPATNNDGGDCDQGKRSCRRSMRGNGKCDIQCNVKNLSWDKGDCCNPLNADTSANCLDPFSPYRTFLTLEEFKNIISVDAKQGVNVYFAYWNNKEIVGLATFPWQKETFDVLGGVLVRPEDFGVEGQLDTLIHEMGHVLGLWHVHRGISEFDCDHPCLESKASMTEGDLCSDTEPTVASASCRDPEPGRTRCGIGPFTNSPFNNYMSYADGSCTDSFSQQQAARMHCYVDLTYSSWLSSKSEIKPPAPPLPPVVTGKGVSLNWLPPLSQELYLPNEARCAECTYESAYIQYGHLATESRETFKEFNAPSEATGPPDSEPCKLSFNSWVADPSYCVPSSFPFSQESNGQICSLSVTFRTPVIPYSISIWITYKARQGLSDVVLKFVDGTSASIGAARGTCDQTYSVIIPQVLPWMALEKEWKEIEGLLLVVSEPLVSVDAVQVISTANHASCSLCKAPRYRVFRNPPFRIGQDYVETTEPKLKDSSTEPGKTYTYRVSAFLGNKSSLLSPPLVYEQGQDLCGNGHVNPFREKCDDGNTLNGDGCDRNCQIEEGFFCFGSPSACYWHKGDGICDYLEKDLVVEDCGYSTPRGFKDQWAYRVEISPPTDPCPSSSLLGPPSMNPERCNSVDHNSSVAWRSCSGMESNFQIQAYFKELSVAASVTLYLERDGKIGQTDYDAVNGISKEEEFGPPEATVYLIFEDDELQLLGNVYLSCSLNPLTITVRQDLSQSFKLTKGVRINFYSPQSSFDSIRLRSLNHVNPMEISRCLEETPHSLYSPYLGKCVTTSNCPATQCQEPLVKNGQLRCTGLREGDTCSLSCDPGYYHFRDESINSFEVTITYNSNIRKDSKVRCIAGNWLGDSLTCRPIDCRQVKIPHADAVCPEGTTFGRNCSFKCRPPARMRSASNGANGLGAVVTCTEMGLWSEPESLCHLSCPVPSGHEHAVLTDENCEKMKSFKYGQSCKFRCLIGYNVLMKGSVPKKSFFARCNGSGVWTGPVCVPMTCPPPDISDGGVLKCSNGYRFGSVCKLECPKPQKRKESLTSIDNIDNSYFISKCGSVGKWDPSFKACPPTTDYCPLPKTDSSVLFDCEEGIRRTQFPTGQKCSVRCSDIDEELIVSSPSSQLGYTIIRESEIRCTGRGTWQPNPEFFQCHFKCMTDFINDTYCNPINNRPDCNWDGGDCCESTLKVKGQKVVPVPPNCAERCGCLDPDGK